MDEALFFKESDGIIYIRAQGHLTAALCPQLKARAFARIEESPPVKEIFMDFGPCEYMDSTFLGLVVGINKRFKASTGKTVVLLKPSQTCLGLLRTIGVTKLVTISEETVAFPQPMEAMALGPRATAQFILDAHENLTEMSKENQSRFSSLTKTLKDSLGKED